MKPHLKSVYSEANTERIIDSETGEELEVIQEIKDRKILVNNEKEFLQLFFSISGILDEMSLSESRVLLHLALICDKENKVVLVKTNKEELAEKANVSYGTFNNAISTLVKKKILIRLGNSVYRIHPRYVWKSKSVDRDKMLKYILEVECPNC